MNTLTDLFFDCLADIYDAEKRIAKALPAMVDAANSKELRTALQSHLRETEGHVNKVERVFRCFDRDPQANKCEATVGLLDEADELLDDFEDSPALDAAIIAGAQKLEHYEIATYGCLVTWAGLLGNPEAASLLREILDEEKGANSRLNGIALSESNIEALTDEDEPANRGATTFPTAPPVF
jgi:ferritin-like metal-binding protein YciE